VNRREGDWPGLMRAAVAGDAAAYDRLLRDLASVLRPIARRGLARAGRPDSDAEDIVQDTLLAVHLKRHTWDAAQPLGPWVRAIAHHKLVDALRRRGGHYDLPIEEFFEVIPAEERTETLAEREAERHIKTLPERQRDVIRAIAVEGASIAEAAARLEITPGAVRVALHRGLTALAVRIRAMEGK
jgi:RNA polymerase sigma-70 factor (ECF subfamily)